VKPDLSVFSCESSLMEITEIEIINANAIANFLFSAIVSSFQILVSNSYSTVNLSFCSTFNLLYRAARDEIKQITEMSVKNPSPDGMISELKTNGLNDVNARLIKKDPINLSAKDKPEMLSAVEKPVTVYFCASGKAIEMME